MFNRSIAYRLSIFISLAVVAVFMTFIIVIYIYNQRIVIKSIENEANNLSLETVALVHQQLNLTQETTKNLAEQILYYSEHENGDLLLRSTIERYPFLNAIYISIDSINDLSKNYLISRNSDSIEFNTGNENIFRCEKEKEVFDELSVKEHSGWSKVYRCDTGRVQTISYYTPVVYSSERGTSKKIGSVICEISLETLNDTINNIKIGERGFAFLVSENGTFLTHPKKEWVFTRTLFSMPEKSYDSDDIDVGLVVNNKLSGSLVAYPEYLDYEKCWVHYIPIVETGWYLLVVVPYDELYFPLYIMILRMLFISVLGILVIFFIVTYISNKQIQPLSKVTTQLNRFSSLSGEGKINTLNEVKIVSESLESLRNWYERYRVNQYQEKKLSKQQKQDLLEASEIQMSLINTDFSGFNQQQNDIDLFAVYTPAKTVSGDLFDFFFIDDDNLFISIGDVSGKAISAAFFMSIAQTIIKRNAKLRDPDKIVFQVNNELTTANQHQFFLTLFIGVFNLKSGKLNYCNAAHTSTNIIRNNGEITELNQSHGMPLGIYSNKKYSGASINIHRGDTIWLYTDGVTELQNEEKEQFGKIRMNQELGLLSGKPPKDIIEQMVITLEKFRGEAEQSDDITIMAINYKAIKKA